MKKVIAVLLSISLVFCFAACGKTPQKNEGSNESSAISENENTISENLPDDEAEISSEPEQDIDNSSAATNSQKPAESSKPDETGTPSQTVKPSEENNSSSDTETQKPTESEAPDNSSVPSEEPNTESSNPSSDSTSTGSQQTPAVSKPANSGPIETEDDIFYR